MAKNLISVNVYKKLKNIPFLLRISLFFVILHKNSKKQ